MTAPDLAAPVEGIASPSDTKAGHTEVRQASTRKGRYEFLDALRGVAAMAVVVQHAVEQVWPAWARISLSWFRMGEFGVVVFFLCSGFIIPASLERHGSQSRFWIGRFFRLYPVYWTALAAVLVLHFGFGRYPLDASYVDAPLRATLANATMLQGFLGAPLALGQSWSLAYELAFYGLVSALFVAGLHRRSIPLALAGLAVAVVPITGRMPGNALAGLGPKRAVAFLLLTAGAALAVGWACRGAGPMRWLAMGIVVVVVPLVLNRPENFRSTLYFFATLFVGTALYRWTAGQIDGRVIAGVVGLAAAAILAMNLTGDLDAVPDVSSGELRRAEIVTNLGAYAVFLLALARRHARFAPTLLLLGTISYSLYLNHSLVIYGLGWVAGNGIATAAVWVLLSVAISAVTYRFVERPAIEAGRRVMARRKPDTAHAGAASKA
jgi:peptidoglycan/LPS O-acetylase OafA/YrhL